MTPETLYKAARGVCTLGPHRLGARYAMAIYQGVVREVFEIPCHQYQ
jgi:hypothetical protein